MEVRCNSLLLAERTPRPSGEVIGRRVETSNIMSAADAMEGILDRRRRTRSLENIEQVKRNIGRSSRQHCDLRKSVGPSTPSLKTADLGESTGICPGTKDYLR